MFLVVFAAEGDLESTKLGPGGLKTVNKCTKDIMCADQTSHRSLPQQMPEGQVTP